MRSRFWYPVLAGALAVTGCGGSVETAAKPSGLTGQVIPGGPVVGILGQGWDAVTEEMRGQCLDSGPVISLSNQQSNITFNASMSHAQVAEQLGFNFSAKARFRLFSGEAKASFARATSSENLALALYYSAEYMTGTQQLDQTRYTFLYPTTATNWYQKCGDQFMSRRDVGGRIWLLYRIDFDNSSTKQEFAAEVGVSFSAGSVNASVQSKASKYANRAWIHVEAFQEGGNVLQLAQVVGGTVDPGSAARVIMDCSMANLAPCGTFMANGIAYATTTFQSSLATMPADRLYTFVDYGIAAPPPPAPIPPPVRIVPDSASAARRTLTSLNDANIEMQDRIKTLNGAAAGSVNGALAALLPTYGNVVQLNLQILQDGKAKCWDLLDPSNAASVSACVSAASMTTLRSLGYDDSLTIAKLETAPRQGVHRLWNGRFHFYSLDPTEGIGCCGYGLEFYNYFYLEKNARPTNVPLYRCVLRNGSHLYTLSPSCEGNGIYESQLGYIATTQLPGSTPLYRLYNPGSGDHFYASNPSDKAIALGGGYYLESTVGYVWLQP